VAVDRGERCVEDMAKLDGAARAGAAIQVPEPDLTPQEIIARAEAMRPALLERQAETEALTWYPQATHQAFLEAGFYRILQPRRFGGYEFDLPTFFKVVIELSRGCPSSGWCYALASAHVLMMVGVFDEAAQIEIFSADGDFRAACFGFQAGELTPAPGGWRITGRWPYASGAPYSTHYIGHTRAPPAEPGGEPGPEVVFVLPRGEWRLGNDWGDVLGLKGSGSHSVIAENGFIPTDFLVQGSLMMGRTDGVRVRVHDNPMYRGRMGAVGSAELASVAVGAAKAALDEYGRIITSRTATMQPSTLRVDLQDYQRYWGRAAGKIAAAEAIIVRMGEEHMELTRREADGGAAFGAEDDMRLTLAVQEAGRLAWEAVEEYLFRTAGSSAARDGQRMQRYFRDLGAYWSHNAPSLDDHFAALYARIHFGRLSGPGQAAR
jgi:3-hydroxy-9,10-secoandrosta-1,3,5(10)-triene-9,17-dione monooxygenase